MRKPIALALASTVLATVALSSSVYPEQGPHSSGQPTAQTKAATARQIIDNSVTALTDDNRNGSTAEDLATPHTALPYATGDDYASAYADCAAHGWDAGIVNACRWTAAMHFGGQHDLYYYIHHNVTEA